MKSKNRKMKQDAAIRLMKDVAAGKKPPMALLDAMYTEAPPPIRAFLDHHIMNIVSVEIPKMRYCHENGVTISMDADEYSTVEDVFETTMAYAQKKAPEVFKEFTATLIHGGGEIAKAIDTSIRRHTLDEKVINREAYMDVLSFHARILSAISGLTVVPDGSNPSEFDTTTK